MSLAERLQPLFDRLPEDKRRARHDLWQQLVDEGFPGRKHERWRFTDIAEAVAEDCETADGFTSVTNGRFKGGWTTRHHGRPDTGRHAIQMELAQSTYLTAEHAPWSYDSAKAARLRARHGHDLLQPAVHVHAHVAEHPGWHVAERKRRLLQRCRVHVR